jgi:hypothetical protein
VDSRRFRRPGPQPTGHPLCGHHPAVRTASLGGRSSASTSATLAVSAGGGRCPLPQPTGVHEGRRPAAAVSPPCSGAAAVSAVNNGRSASTRPHPAAPRTLPRCPVPRTPAGVPRQVRAAGGQRQSGRSDTGRGWWTPAARKYPAALRTPATAAGSCGHDGNALLDSRQQHRPPPPQGPTRNGIASCGIGQHHHVIGPWQRISRYDPAGRVCGKASENTSTTDCNRKVAGASLTEQAKASGREHQIELWCYPARDTSRPDSRSLPLWVTKPSGSGLADWAAYLPSCPRTAPAGNTVLWMFT